MEAAPLKEGKKLQSTHETTSQSEKNVTVMGPVFRKPQVIHGKKFPFDIKSNPTLGNEVESTERQWEGNAY